MPGRPKKNQTAENAKDSSQIPATMAVTANPAGPPIPTAPIQDPGRSYLSILTEGDDDDIEQLPRLPKRVGKPGRPLDHQLLVDDERGWTIFNNLLKLQCTIAEVAAVFGRSEQWVRDRVREVHGTTFAAYADQVRPLGMLSIRRKQMQLAMSGDRQMLIFLGQNMLNQSTKTKAEVTGKDGGPIQREDVTDPARIVLEGLAAIAERQRIAQDARAQLSSSQMEGPVKMIEAPDVAHAEENHG